MLKKTIHITVWIIFMATIGALISTKSMTIDVQRVVKGALMGGAIGYFIGVLFANLKS